MVGWLLSDRDERFEHGKQGNAGFAMRWNARYLLLAGALANNQTTRDLFNGRVLDGPTLRGVTHPDHQRNADTEVPEDLVQRAERRI